MKRKWQRRQVQMLALLLALLPAVLLGQRLQLALAWSRRLPREQSRRVWTQ